MSLCLLTTDTGSFCRVSSNQSSVFGLLLHMAVVLWMRWTDKVLNAAFAGKGPRLIRSGPFRRIRHPYYAAAIVGKVAIALGIY